MTNPVASTQTEVSIYHFPLKGTKASYRNQIWANQIKPDQGQEMYKMNLVYRVMLDNKKLVRTTEVMSEEVRGQYEEAKDGKILNINNNNCK